MADPLTGAFLDRQKLPGSVGMAQKPLDRFQALRSAEYLQCKWQAAAVVTSKGVRARAAKPDRTCK